MSGLSCNIYKTTETLTKEENNSPLAKCLNRSTPAGIISLALLLDSVCIFCPFLFLPSEIHISAKNGAKF